MTKRRVILTPFSLQRMFSDHKFKQGRTLSICQILLLHNYQEQVWCPDVYLVLCLMTHKKVVHTRKCEACPRTTIIRATVHLKVLLLAEATRFYRLENRHRQEKY